MMRLAKNGFGFALALLLGCNSVIAATYYVAPPPTGDNTNPGSESMPWATLQHAADNVAADDTVLVREGDYTGMYLDTSGTQALPIVFRNYPDETPEIIADNATTPDGINIEGADWVTIEGFTVNGRGRAGIRAVLCENVTLRGNRMDLNFRWGILTGFCDDLLIEFNETSRSTDEHGIYVSNSGDRPTIRNNLIWGNNANGIHMNGDINTPPGDGIISNALVENNIIFDNGVAGGSGINCDGVQNSLIRNNLIYDSHASGISLYQIDGGGPSSGNRVLNNTVLLASDGRWAMNIQDGAVNNTLRNNILYSAHSFRGAIDISMDSLPGLDSNFNAMEDRVTLDGGNSVLSLSQWQSQQSQDASSFATDLTGLFADQGNDNFHLLASSPAVDTGEFNVDVPTDLEGTVRPIGVTHDIGAYEWGDVLFADSLESP